VSVNSSVLVGVAVMDPSQHNKCCDKISSSSAQRYLLFSSTTITASTLVTAATASDCKGDDTFAVAAAVAKSLAQYDQHSIGKRSAAVTKRNCQSTYC
jgi:hypothetical protein